MEIKESKYKRIAQDIADFKLNQQKVKELIKKYPENKLVEKLAEEISDLIEDFIYRKESEVCKILVKLFGVSDWTTYNDNTQTYIVKNVKGKGYPDNENIIKQVSKKTDISIDDLSRILNDDFMSDLWIDEVESYDKFLSKKYKDYSSLGRSGGYRGVPSEVDMIEVDIPALSKFISSKLKDPKIIKKLTESSELKATEIADTLSYILLDEFDFKKSVEFIKLSQSWKRDLNNLDKDINGILKDLADTKYWVNLIMSNGYYE